MLSKKLNYIMGNIIKVTISLLLLGLPGAGSPNVIWDESAGSPLPFTWNYTNFDGFNINGSGTENLTILQTDLGAAAGKTRTIRSWDNPDGAGMVYSTKRYLVEYEVHKNKGLSVYGGLDDSGWKTHYGDSQGKNYAKINLCKLKERKYLRR